MSRIDTQTDDDYDTDEFDLAEFIDDKSSLFAVLGVFVATIQSLAAVGLIATILGIPVVAIDKIRGVSPYDCAG